MERHSSSTFPVHYRPAMTGDGTYQTLSEENTLLRGEIRESRKAAEITASLVVKQFEQTEKILRRFQIANAQRKTVLDSASQISIIATDTNGTITVFNKGAENLLGYTAEEVIGKQTPTIFHKESELTLKSKQLSSELGVRIEGSEIFFALADQETSKRMQWTYIRKDSSRFPVRMSINALRNPDGTLGGFLCIATDVTEREYSQRALKESERKHRLLIRNLPNIVYRGCLDGTIDFFDNKIETLTGYNRDDFSLGRITWFDLVHPDDLDEAKQVFIKALKTDHAYIREYRFTTKNGDIVWVQEGGQIIYGEDGEVEYITGAFLDITKRKLAEQALHESEQKYRSLFDSGPNPIFVLDWQNDEILDANPSAEGTYGYSKSELLGRPFSKLGSFGYQNFTSQLPDNGHQAQVCVISQKERHFKKGHHPFYVRITACPTRYRERAAIILAVTDITEVIEKDAQLIQASKMSTLGEMSAGIAHELNQPLNAIKMGNEYLKMMVEKNRKIPPRYLKQVAGEVSDQVDRASKIINSLREFGRKPDFDKEKVNINVPIREVLGIIGRQLRLQNINIRLELDEMLPLIWAQTNRLEQVFFNLITNARDAINEKRKTDRRPDVHAITIRSFFQKDRVVVAVSDTGIGIRGDDKEKIYEPFFTTKGVSEGMGLGLSIIYGIVKEYGGRIEIKSKPGKGTTFIQSYPVASNKMNS